MQWPSFTLILTELFLVYIIYSIYNLSLLFVAPACEDNTLCLTSYLNQKPQLQLQVYSSVDRYPTAQQVDFVYNNKNFNYTHANTL